MCVCVVLPLRLLVEYGELNVFTAVGSDVPNGFTAVGSDILNVAAMPKHYCSVRTTCVCIYPFFFFLHFTQQSLNKKNS